MTFARNVVFVGDVSLETFHAGSGRPVICATHAFNPATESGGLIAGSLAAISETVAVNLRSLGGSDQGEGSQLSMEQAVHDLEAVRVALGHDRWVFGGGSAGGFIGMRYALMFPESLQALILVGTAPSFRAILDPSSVYHPEHPDHPHIVSAELEPPEGARPWTEVVWPLFSHVVEPVVREARAAGPVGAVRFRAFSAELPHYDLEPRLADIEVPTLVVHGRHDASMPVRQGEIIADAIPGAELVIMEGSGHFPFWEQPAEFDRIVRGFLNRVVEH